VVGLRRVRQCETVGIDPGCCHEESCGGA
jgi:hypothetical protein